MAHPQLPVKLQPPPESSAAPLSPPPRSSWLVDAAASLPKLTVNSLISSERKWHRNKKTTTGNTEDHIFLSSNACKLWSAVTGQVRKHLRGFCSPCRQSSSDPGSPFPACRSPSCRSGSPSGCSRVPSGSTRLPSYRKLLVSYPELPRWTAYTKADIANSVS